MLEWTRTAPCHAAAAAQQLGGRVGCHNQDLEPIFTAMLTPTTFLADVFDLATNEGLGGVVQHEQLATVLLARHFQSLHVEQRALAVSLLW